MQTALVTMFGFLLFCMMYIAFGIFASSLTENQIIAARISIAFFIITWVLPDFNTNLSGLSFVNMLYKYTQGEIDIAKYIKLINSVITTTTVAAINLPNTIFVILSGYVNSNCSVPDFLSSENDLIVSNGIITANTIIVGNE